MQLITKEIREGKHLGEIVYVCHYSRPDLDKKPLRSVPPTLVVIVDNHFLPKNKVVYYSESHFVPLNTAGKQLKKIISPVDNTGFRSMPGNELFVFTEEEECILAWNNQILDHTIMIQKKIDCAADYWRSELDELVLKKK